MKYESRPLTELGAKLIDKKLHKQKVVLLKIDTGGGKTFMAIHAIGRIMKNHPQKTANVLVLTTSKQKNDLYFEQSFKAYTKATGVKFNIYVTNYEQLYAPNHKYDAYNWMRKKPKKSTIILMDEGHHAKNPTSKTSKQIIRLSKLPSFSRAIFLTATPITNSLLDAEMYLIMAGFYKNKTQFENLHVQKWDDHFKLIVKDKSGKIDNNLLNYPWYIINLLNKITVYIDTDKLKPKVFLSEKTFKFNKFVQHDYRQIRKQLQDGLIESSSECIAMQRQFVAEHQEARLDYMKKIIQSPKRPQTPILIFYQYVAEFESLYAFIKKELPDYRLRIINGATKTQNPSAKPKHNKTIVLIQYQAGGEGLNTPWSNFSIFFTPAFSAEKYIQARGRNVRAMQKGPVYQIRFKVKNTINDQMWTKIIDQKQKFTKKLQQELINSQD